MHESILPASRPLSPPHPGCDACGFSFISVRGKEKGNNVLLVAKERNRRLGWRTRRCRSSAPGGLALASLALCRAEGRRSGRRWAGSARRRLRRDGPRRRAGRRRRCSIAASSLRRLRRALAVDACPHTRCCCWSAGRRRVRPLVRDIDRQVGPQSPWPGVAAAAPSRALCRRSGVCTRRAASVRRRLCCSRSPERRRRRAPLRLWTRRCRPLASPGRPCRLGTGNGRINQRPQARSVADGCTGNARGRPQAASDGASIDRRGTAARAVPSLSFSRILVLLLIPGPRRRAQGPRREPPDACRARAAASASPQPGPALTSAPGTSAPLAAAPCRRHETERLVCAVRRRKQPLGGRRGGSQGGNRLPHSESPGKSNPVRLICDGQRAHLALCKQFNTMLGELAGTHRRCVSVRARFRCRRAALAAWKPTGDVRAASLKSMRSPFLRPALRPAPRACAMPTFPPQNKLCWSPTAASTSRAVTSATRILYVAATRHFLHSLASSVALRPGAAAAPTPPLVH